MIPSPDIERCECCGAILKKREEPCPLTPTQLRLVKEIAKGKLTKQIALDLGMAPSTVRSQLYAAYRRLGVNDRAQAALVAYSKGWI